jgi:quinol monooxygenase YgiN
VIGGFGGTMEIYIFARFHVREGMEGETEKALREVVKFSREEAGCVNIHAYRAIRDGRLYYIHSTWKDADAFELHARLPHTVRFLERITELSDQERDVRRTERID